MAVILVRAGMTGKGHVVVSLFSVLLACYVNISIMAG